MAHTETAHQSCRSEKSVGQWLVLKWFSLLVVLSLFPLASLEAKIKRRTQYAFDQVWKTTIRALRIDLKVEITEKDMDSGYVLFEMTHEKKIYQGSAEIIERPPEYQSYDVTLIIDIPKRATYIESMIAEKIKTRLREDYGLAPSPPEKTPKEKPEKKDGESESDKNGKEQAEVGKLR